MNISPTTLLPSALFGFVTTLARVLLATSIGTQIDSQNRLRGMLSFSTVSNNNLLFIK